MHSKQNRRISPQNMPSIIRHTTFTVKRKIKEPFKSISFYFNPFPNTKYCSHHPSVHGANLGAFSVGDGGTRFIVFLLLNPHLLEGRQRRQNGSSNPHRILPLGWCDDLNRHRVRCQRLDFLLHSLWDTLVHRGTSRHHHISIQILPDINITLHDGREGQFVDSLLFQSQELRLEQCLRCSEPLCSDSDHLTVGQFVILLQFTGLLRFLHFIIKIGCNVAQFLLDVTDDFLLCSGGERVPSLRQDLLQIFSDIPSRQIQSLHCVRQTVPFVNGHSVSHSITGIQHDTRSPSRCIQR